MSTSQRDVSRGLEAFVENDDWTGAASYRIKLSKREFETHTAAAMSLTSIGRASGTQQIGTSSLVETQETRSDASESIMVGMRVRGKY
jgi:hypothetical protein